MIFRETKDACSIAGITPKRLNEIINLGHYPCIPKTSPGVPRHFELDDLVCLKAYKILTENGITSAVAGRFSCLVREGMGHDTRLANLYLQSDGGISVEILDENGNGGFYGLSATLEPKKTPVSFELNVQELRDEVHQAIDTGL